MTTQKTTTKRKTARKPKEPRATKLKRLLAEAGEYGQTQSWLPLIDRWTAEEGLKITQQPSEPCVARLAGIEGRSPAGPQNALVNWTNAARRALTRMEAGI